MVMLATVVAGVEVLVVEAGGVVVEVETTTVVVTATAAAIEVVVADEEGAALLAEKPMVDQRLPPQRSLPNICRKLPRTSHHCNNQPSTKTSHLQTRPPTLFAMAHMPAVMPGAGRWRWRANARDEARSSSSSSSSSVGAMVEVVAKAEEDHRAMGGNKTAGPPLQTLRPAKQHVKPKERLSHDHRRTATLEPNQKRPRKCHRKRPTTRRHHKIPSQQRSQPPLLPRVA
jgi:hypothetical protein